MSSAMNRHAWKRTSALGEPARGVCPYCGVRGGMSLPLTGWCPKAPGQDDQVVNMLEEDRE